MGKKVLSWLVVSVILVAIFLSFISIFLSPEVPFKYAEIPQSTIDYFKRLKDQLIIFNPNPSLGDWTNDKPGTNKVVEYSCIEDDNFIVYFIPETKSESRAPDVISYANAAIKPLEELMDRYYYPSMVNGRKLPIFITNDKKEYDNIINKLLGNWGQGGGTSVGVTLFEASSLGMRTIAIVLSDRAWNLETDIEYPRKVLWHEMNHYVYFTALQMDLPIMPLEWFTEGIAEYFAKSTFREEEISFYEAQKLYLTKELEDSYDNYWVGYSVFNFMEDAYGKEKVKQCVKGSYNNIITKVFVSELNTTLTDFDGQWKEYIYAHY